jgi:hypothetical protein
MKHVLTTIALAISAPLLLAAAAPAQPGNAPSAAPKKFTAEYREPRHLQIYHRVKARKVLEELTEFMSPLQLDHDLSS